MSRALGTDGRAAPAAVGTAAGDGPGDGDGPQRILLITGMSGAGKTAALKALEDIGYEAIDHVPLSLLNRLVTPAEAVGEGSRRPLAVGMDVRTRDFGVDAALAEINRLLQERHADVTLAFLDCDDDELRRRYTETRHRHPLAIDRPVSDGIALEREIVSPLRARADVVIDTTSLALGALKRIVEGHFGLRDGSSLTVFVTSFSFRLGLPREADLVFDLRFLANPHYDPTLRYMTGIEEPVAAYIRRDEGLQPFLDALTGLMKPLLPRYAAEGKSYLTIATGCTGGRHRSVFIAEELGRWLRDQGVPVHLHHRDLNRPE